MMHPFDREKLIMICKCFAAGGITLYSFRLGRLAYEYINSSYFY